MSSYSSRSDALGPTSTNRGGRSTDLRIEHDRIALSATYSPAGNTAIVALHGAGEGTRDGVLYEHLHEVLPPAGIGVVTFDRRGEGESTGDSSRGRFEIQARDALAVVDAIDVDRVGLWGHSQGGWVAPLAAVASDRVDFLVLVSSTGVTPSEQMMYATAEQLRRAGYDEVDDESRRLWIEEMDFDPRPVFARVRVPTLVFYGERDSWTPVAPSVDAWRAARGGEVDIVVVPEADHDLALPDGTLAPQYERTLVDWVLTRARARRAS